MMFSKTMDTRITIKFNQKILKFCLVIVNELSKEISVVFTNLHTFF